MKKTLRLAAISVMALSFTTGVAAASSGTIGTTGPDSYNSIRHESSTERRVENRNDVDVENDNPQDARSGRARVSNNTTGGNASSGDATNDSLLRATIRLNNSGSADAAVSGLSGTNNTASINNTGPDSYNRVSFENRSRVNIENDNDVQVRNDNEQNATSGSARVSGNTTGGSATSGNASNISTTETVIEITN